MKYNFEKPNYIGKMDPECVPICDAMNQIPGIETFASCQGHGHRPMWIFFHAEDMDSLTTLVDNLTYPWRVEVRSGRNSIPEKTYFLLIGDENITMEEANIIASDIAE